MITKLLKTKIPRNYLVLGVILLATFLMRFPSLYEPFWYGDEGIFAAVGRSLNFNEVLYRDTWDNKPPMIYLTYALIFKLFSVSMFSLRLVTAIAVLATCVCIYEIALKITSKNRALAAAFTFGLLTSLRIIEGNLALTEIFMILPISLAMMMAIYRKFDKLSLFGAGILIAIASLFKQVGAFEAGALGIFLFFYIKSFKEFFKSGLYLSAGFALPYLMTVLYFARYGIVGEYIFGAYTYYQIYLSESPRYALLVNLLKYLPIIAIIGYCFLLKRRRQKVDLKLLILFWMAFSFLGSYFSGRAYGHYLVQAVPPLTLALVMVAKNLKLTREKIIFSAFFFLPFIGLTILLFSTVFRWNPIEQVRYWNNFISYANRTKGVDDYNNFFDGNVNTIMALNDFLKKHGAAGKSVYIWGDYPWLYAISDVNNPSRYVTSFHVFGVPPKIGREEVIADLEKKSPVYIIKPKSSIGYFVEFENFLASNYNFVFKVDEADVYVKSGN